MAEMARPMGLHNPVTMISAAVTIKAPMATEKPPSNGVNVARKAAPGVDQAALTGIPVLKARKIPHNPIETDSAINPEAASPAVAPTPYNPCTTIANELANPTNAARMPAAKAFSEKSFFTKRLSNHSCGGYRDSLLKNRTYYKINITK